MIMQRKIRPIAAILNYANRMSISSKFVVMYVMVFAIPIFFYAIYSFNTTNQSIQSSYNQQSKEDLNAVFDNIARNIDVSETVIGTVLDNNGFLEFINGNMLEDDLQLIQFKQSEYAQIVNVKNLNPTINNIKFFIDNSGIYDLPPILEGKKDFRDQALFSHLVDMQGREYFKLNYDDTNAAGAEVKVVSLFRGMTNGRYDGIIEVNMLQSKFFQDLYAAPEEKNAMLLVMEGHEPRQLIFNEESGFFKQRADQFAVLAEHLATHVNKEGGSFQFEATNERFTVNYKYIKNLDSYLYQIYSLEGITGKIREVRNHILIAVFVALIVLCLVTYSLSSILLKKVGVVISSMHKVQAGDLNVTIPVRGGDEIDELAGHFNTTVIKVKDLISQLLSKQLIANEAENKALQSQINSHFVYNVLESIRMLAEMEQKPEISEAIFSLGKMMRYSMRWKAQHIPLAEEAAMSGNYVKLMNIIADIQVELTVQMDQELEQYPIPKMSIEPLVENAVTHGIEPRGSQGRVSINAEVSGDCVLISVTDDGTGIEKEELARINRALLEEDLNHIELSSESGIGLLNVHKRIRMFYGKGYGISIASEKNEYTRVEMRLPCKKHIGGW